MGTRGSPPHRCPARRGRGRLHRTSGRRGRDPAGTSGRGRRLLRRVLRTELQPRPAPGARAGLSQGLSLPVHHLGNHGDPLRSGAGATHQRRAARSHPVSARSHPVSSNCRGWSARTSLGAPVGQGAVGPAYASLRALSDSVTNCSKALTLAGTSAALGRKSQTRALGSVQRGSTPLSLPFATSSSARKAGSSPTPASAWSSERVKNRSLLTRVERSLTV